MTGGPATAAPPPLLIACALRIERTALRSTSYRGSRERGAPERYEVLRTGMGPRAAERAVGSKLAEPELRGAAVLATGFCAGLLPGMSPGDLIVAEETRDPRGTVACAGTALLAEALARAVPGRTVHLGALTGSDHVVRGQERAQLRRRRHRGRHGIGRHPLDRDPGRERPGRRGPSGCGRPGDRGRSGA